jgi:hypothetical protein
MSGNIVQNWTKTVQCIGYGTLAAVLAAGFIVMGMAISKIRSAKKNKGFGYFIISFSALITLGLSIYFAIKLTQARAVSKGLMAKAAANAGLS